MSDRTDPPDRSSEELTHFARETSAGVVPPSFDSLVAVQRRRRRATLLGTAGATVAAVALVATTVQATYDDRSTPTPPATSTDSSAPSPSPTTDEPSPDAELTATQIVDSPDSRIAAIRVVPNGESSTVAVSWEYCPPDPCGGTRLALAVSSDGFRTRTDTSLRGRGYPILHDGGEGTVPVSMGRDVLRLLRPDGFSVSAGSSYASGVMVFTEGALNTVTAVEKIHRSLDGGATWEVFTPMQGQTDERLYDGGVIVLPDQRLLVEVTGWSGDSLRSGRDPQAIAAAAPQDHPPGRGELRLQVREPKQQIAASIHLWREVCDVVEVRPVGPSAHVEPTGVVAGTTTDLGNTWRESLAR